MDAESIEPGPEKPKRTRVHRGDMPAFESLNGKERRYVEAVVGGAPNKAAAARAAGYVGDSARAHVPRLNAKPAIREAMRECMEVIGLDASGLAGRLKLGMDSAMSYGLDRLGNAVELGPDYHARAKHVDMALKVIGAYPDPRADNVQAVQVVIVQPENSLAAANPFSAPVIIDASGSPSGDRQAEESGGT